MGQQSNWRFCMKCNAMFYAGYQGGVCSGGGTHTAQGLLFNLPYGVAASGNAQDNWRFCLKCNVMFFNGYSGGKCAAGGTHQAQGLLFVLPHNVGATPTTQNNWRFCQSCNALFFAGYVGGICPAGGAHSAQGFNFVLPFTVADSDYTLIIGINPSATKFGDVNAGDNPGHTIVAFRNSSGTLVKVFSYGPTALSAGAALACSAPGRTGYHLLANDEYKLYEWPITNDQYTRAVDKIKEIDLNPGIFSGTHQCTTTSLEVVTAAGVAVPGGKGNIIIPLCPSANGVSAPVFLDRELEKQFLTAGKKVKRVRGSDFKGLVDIQDK
jgi:hypothetical protein